MDNHLYKSLQKFMHNNSKNIAVRICDTEVVVESNKNSLMVIHVDDLSIGEIKKSIELIKHDIMLLKNSSYMDDYRKEFSDFVTLMKTFMRNYKIETLNIE
jgi:hypothetical protein